MAHLEWMCPNDLILIRRPLSAVQSYTTVRLPYYIG